MVIFLMQMDHIEKPLKRRKSKNNLSKSKIEDHSIKCECTSSTNLNIKSEDLTKDTFGVFPKAIKSITIVARTLHLLNVRNIGIFTSFTENNPKST